jgi:hypothetical protein
MYIRWIHRKHKSAHAMHMTFHDAYLVQSYRDRKGKPRQRTIVYLGNLREVDDQLPGIERELFLLRARQVLAGLPELPVDEQGKLWEYLQQIVHPLTDEELMQAFHQNLHWYAHACHQRGLPLPTTRQLILLVEATKEAVHAASVENP